MKLSYRPYLLEFKHPFGVSSNVRIETPSVFVKLESENKVGYGEACLPMYLGETVDGTLNFLGKARAFFRNFDPTLPLEFFVNECDTLMTEHYAAKAAIDIALHDLYGKLENKPVYELLGVEKSEPIFTSFTIGIANQELIAQKIKEAADFQILKIKMGTDDDRGLLELVRKHTDKALYVDVNQGWKDKVYALEMISWMKEMGVLLVEQPMPVEMKAEMAWLTERSPLPTFADESVKRLKDVIGLKGVFSGVNIKLMKCTGLHEAMKIIDFCKQNDLKILIGCMAESSCATSAMAHLLSFADFVDLDAPCLYKNDPFDGVKYQSGKIFQNDLPGIGARPQSQIFN